MYAAHFGLRDDPFKLTPNPRLAYRSRNFEGALEAARAWLELRAGAFLIEAEAGLGKTAFLKVFAEELLQRGVEHAYETGRRWSTAEELLASRSGVLMIDDAANLAPSELRSLLNAADADGVKLLIASLPGRLPDFSNFNGLRTVLRPLSAQEAADYVRTKCALAGGSAESVFSADALALIAAGSSGSPRLINRVCSASLFMAALNGDQEVTAARIRETLKEFELPLPEHAPQGRVVEPVEALSAAPAPAAGRSEIPSAPFMLRFEEERSQTGIYYLRERRSGLGFLRHFARAPGGLPGVGAALAAGAAAALLMPMIRETLVPARLPAPTEIASTTASEHQPPVAEEGRAAASQAAFPPPPEVAAISPEEVRTAAAPDADAAPAVSPEVEPDTTLDAEPEPRDAARLARGPFPSSPEVYGAALAKGEERAEREPGAASPSGPALASEEAGASGAVSEPAPRPVVRQNAGPTLRVAFPASKPRPPAAAAPSSRRAVAQSAPRTAPQAEEEPESRGRESARTVVAAIPRPLAAPRPLEQARPAPSRPLERAALEDPRLLKAALADGADPNTQYAGAGRPLAIAAQGRRAEAVAILLSYGADPNLEAADSATALMYAAWVGDRRSAALLIEAGARINVANVDGKTPLMAAAARGHSSLCELLLSRGADPNARTIQGWTALMYAVWNGHADVAKLLIQQGADPHVRSADGETAAELASSRDRRLAALFQ